MAVGRVLFRATALGLAAAAAGSLHAVSNWTPPKTLPPVVLPEKGVLVDSARGLHAALLSSPVLSGAHLDGIRACAEHGLTSADAEGDLFAANDLRLLLALLAARDGRADDALRLYEEAAHAAPFDPRPCALAHHLCLLLGRVQESAPWHAAYRRLVPGIEGFRRAPGLESHVTKELIRELVVAAAVGGLCNFADPVDRICVISAAGGKLYDSLVAALKDEELSVVERLQLRALRVYLRARVKQLQRREKRGILGGGGDEQAPVSC